MLTPLALSLSKGEVETGARIALRRIETWRSHGTQYPAPPSGPLQRQRAGVSNRADDPIV